MTNAMDRRIKRLEQGAEPSSTGELYAKFKDKKHLARAIWHFIYAPQPNDSEAQIKGRERLIYKLLDGQEWTESERDWISSGSREPLPEA